jgi:hypothetical protein
LQQREALNSDGVALFRGRCFDILPKYPL